MEPRVQINAGERESIKIRIAPKADQGLAEVFVFANDQDEEISDCLLFKIKYKYIRKPISSIQ